MRAIVFLLAIALAAVVQAQGQQRYVYKWSDPDGTVHYTALPPQGVEAERIPIRVAPAAARRQVQQSSSPSSGASDSRQVDSRGRTPEQVAFLKQQCEAARSNIRALESGGGNSRFVGPDGNVIRFTEQERQAEIAENRAYLDEHCGEFQP